MEAENYEETKRHDNTFSLHGILLIVQVSAGLALAGCCGYPMIVNFLDGFFLWFDWFRLFLRNMFFIFIILNALIVSIYFTFLKATEKKKPNDEYITPVPFDARSSPEQSFAPMEVGDYRGGGGGYCNNNSSYQESVLVNTVEESSSYERVVMETNSKNCKRMMSSEKKTKKTRSTTVEYRHRTGSERVMKTEASSWCRSQAMMDQMTGEEFRTTVESFIMQKRRMVMFDWQNGVADYQLQNGGPQLQNGVGYQWHNGLPQLQNGGVHHWQNGLPQLQNGGFEQWQNCVPQLQGQPDYDGTGRHGSYVAISN